MNNDYITLYKGFIMSRKMIRNTMVDIGTDEWGWTVGMRCAYYIDFITLSGPGDQGRLHHVDLTIVLN